MTSYIHTVHPNLVALAHEFCMRNCNCCMTRFQMGNIIEFVIYNMDPFLFTELQTAIIEKFGPETFTTEHRTH